MAGATRRGTGTWLTPPQAEAVAPIVLIFCLVSDELTHHTESATRTPQTVCFSQLFRNLLN